MRKSIKLLSIVFIFMIAIISITGCTKKNKEETSEYLHKMSYTEYVKKIDNKESFVVEIMSKDCSACKGFRPKLVAFLNEYKVDMYYIDLDDFSEEEYESFDKLVKFTGTPTTIFIKDGEEETVSARIVGNVAEDKILAKFKASGIIK